MGFLYKCSCKQGFIEETLFMKGRNRMAKQTDAGIIKTGHMNKTMWGYFFITPAILGLLLFNFGPMLFSLGISFFKWDVVTPAEWIGFKNYTRLAKDPLVLKSLAVTAYYTLLTVPLTTVIGLLVASLLNTKVKMMSVFRTIFYIPSIVPAVASSALWMFLCNPMYGLLNNVLGIFGIPPQNWIYDPYMVIPSLSVIAVWGAGNTVIIYLAGLQGIPRHLYESIEIDGGNTFHKFFNITVPMISPIIFYNVVMGIIGSMQTFTQAYVMTEGGPDNASLFYVLLLYRTAFTNQEMGYASAMAWILFILVAILTFISFKSSNLWVFYEGGSKNGK
jgi:multiple sugar transport system permease protein